MTQEEKDLLIKDLCARLPYWVNVQTTEKDECAYIVGVNDTVNGIFTLHVIEDHDGYDRYVSTEDFKPYLRPISSMTEEEENEFKNSCSIIGFYKYGMFASTPDGYDWLNAHHFDYRGLINKGLALEAPEGMYEKGGSK